MPAPFGPTSPTKLPAGTTRSTPATAICWPYRLNRPCVASVIEPLYEKGEPPPSWIHCRSRVTCSHDDSDSCRTRDPPDIHTTAGKLADLHRRNDEAVHAGSARAVEKQHAKGKMTARERIAALLDEGSFVEIDELARHRSTAFGLEHEPAVRRRRGHRLRHRRRPPGVRVRPGLHRVRRLARRGVRREDRQGHGPGAEDRLPGHRHQRLRRRPHPGGRRLPRASTARSSTATCTPPASSRRSR